MVLILFIIAGYFIFNNLFSPAENRQKPNDWFFKQRAFPYAEINYQNEDIAYVTFSGYRWGDYLSHIYKTTDAGQNWQDISANLPEAPVNDIIVDSWNDSTLYIATDVGVFYSFDQGENWQAMGSGLPNLPVTDIDLHKGSNKLLAATFGRSMYHFDLTQLPTGFEKPKQQIPKNLTLFQNYPNPFNSITTIFFQVKVSTLIML